MEAKSKESKGFIIDGFPVSSAQAKLFEEKIGSPAKILYLCVNDVILKERLVKRSKKERPAWRQIQLMSTLMAALGYPVLDPETNEID